MRAGAQSESDVSRSHFSLRSGSVCRSYFLHSQIGDLLPLRRNRRLTPNDNFNYFWKTTPNWIDKFYRKIPLFGSKFCQLRARKLRVENHSEERFLHFLFYIERGNWACECPARGCWSENKTNSGRMCKNDQFYILLIVIVFCF